MGRPRFAFYDVLNTAIQSFPLCLKQLLDIQYSTHLLPTEIRPSSQSAKGEEKTVGVHSLNFRNAVKIELMRLHIFDIRPAAYHADSADQDLIVTKHYRQKIARYYCQCI